MVLLQPLQHLAESFEMCHVSIGFSDAGGLVCEISKIFRIFIPIMNVGLPN